jgi:hypothetical protein
MKRIKENLSSHIGGMERFLTGQGMRTAPGQVDRAWMAYKQKPHT